MGATNIRQLRRADQYQKRAPGLTSAPVPILNKVKSTEGNARPAQAASPLIPLKQIPRVHLVRHVHELVAPAVGHDHVAAGLEGLQVVGLLGAEELRRVRRGLVDHHGHALGLHALHDALDGARAEVVEVRLHRQAVDVRDQLRLVGMLEINRIVYGLALNKRFELCGYTDGCDSW